MLWRAGRSENSPSWRCGPRPGTQPAGGAGDTTQLHVSLLNLMNRPISWRGVALATPLHHTNERFKKGFTHNYIHTQHCTPALIHPAHCLPVRMASPGLCGGCYGNTDSPGSECDGCCGNPDSPGPCVLDARVTGSPGLCVVVVVDARVTGSPGLCVVVVVVARVSGSPGLCAMVARVTQSSSRSSLERWSMAVLRGSMERAFFLFITSTHTHTRLMWNISDDASMS